MMAQFGAMLGFFIFSGLVRQNRTKFHKNCALCDKSTKIGTMTVYGIVNNIHLFIQKTD